MADQQVSPENPAPAAPAESAGKAAAERDTSSSGSFGPAHEAPFPGLRPFREEEAHLFFGRDGHVTEMLQGLRRNRFVAVLGESGSGKSSLVRAGLLPALHGGRMTGGPGRWRIADCRPGNDPIGNLARALAPIGTRTGESQTAAAIESELRRSSFGLAQAARDRVDSESWILIIVDQFEELFRYKREAMKQTAVNDTAAFARMLLEGARRGGPGVYLMLTMRSEYLGHCSQFRGLDEAIGDGLYLVPRMTQPQLRAAIEGPVAVGGSAIDSALVQRMINDLGDRPDQLPVLQHALLRSWQRSAGDRAKGKPLALEHYQKVGGVSHALSKHADKIYEDLAPELRSLAEKIFKCLTQKDGDSRIRRPSTFGQICAIAGAGTKEEKDQVRDVVDAFAAPGASFLVVPSTARELRDDSPIDISHESLIRQWDRLTRWVDEEADSSDVYRRLAVAAARGDRCWKDPQLQIALDSRAREGWNEAWGSRYRANYAAAIDFLERSRKRRWWWRLSVGAGSILLALAVGISAVLLRGFLQRDLNLRAQRQVGNALGALEQQPDLALLLGLEALKMADTFEARSSLIGAFAFSPYFSTVLDSARVGRTSLGFSSDERTLYFVGEESNLVSWDLETGTRGSVVIEDLESGIFDLHSDSGLLATPKGNEILIWDVETAEPVEPPFTGHENRVFSLKISPDGTRLASGDLDGVVRLWDLEEHRPIELPLMEHEAGVTQLAFSHDGRTLASGADNGAVTLWNAETGASKFSLSEQEGSITGLAFNPNGADLAVSNGSEPVVRFWDPATGKKLGYAPGHQGPVLSLAVAPTGDILASGGFDNRIVIRGDLRTGPLRGHRHYVAGLAFGSSGRVLASSGEDGTVIVWDLTSCLASKTAVLDFAFDPKGQRLASATLEGVEVWDVGKRQPERALKFEGEEDKTLISIAFSPDGRLIAGGSGEGALALWDAVTGAVVGQALAAHEGEVRSLAFSPDGRILASGGEDGKVVFWTVAPFKLHGRLEAHEREVNGVAFHPEGKLLASASDDRTIAIWDVESLEPSGAPLRGHLAQVQAVAFSPDGSVIASAGFDRAVGLWDLESRKRIAPLLLGHDGPVNSVSFSIDGKILASGGSDERIILWSTDRSELGRQIGRPLTDHAGPVRHIAFSPDGRTLASGGLDGTVVLRRIDFSEARVCRIVNRNLSWTEWSSFFPGEPYRETCPDLPPHRSLVEEGHRIAAAEGIEAGAAFLRQYPELTADPEREARRGAAKGRIEEFQRHTRRGEIPMARDAVTAAEEIDPELKVSASLWNTFCWWGALSGYAAEVLDACQRALEMDPESPDIRDSRGLARALSGDSEGAIGDFRFVVEHHSDREVRERRRSWIDQLDAGQDPFTPEEMDALKKASTADQPVE